MKKFAKTVAVAVIILLGANAVFAQEWTKEQTEVWKVVQDSWKAWQAGDADATAAFIHEKYQGWSDSDPLPMGKKAVIDWYQSMKGKIMVENIYLEPARITVIKTVAVVDYYYEFSGTFMTGNESSFKVIKGKNAEFYVNEAGKWLLLGDMTVHVDGEDDED